LGKAFSKQEAQAKLLKAHSATTPYKKLICGDFNNTQFSNVYHIVKGNLTDTFDEKGNGYGSTYNIDYFPARIDFILADPAFNVEAHKVFDIKLSDHFPIMADLSLEKQ
jgi:endonuclease/exonuclease/phosphatase family metal-dependent hydrolase